ncbi:formylmethanofuran dehydrogenase subunit E family protein [Desulforhopalus singaporensis]|uniref:FmdE, Molybdenum formylmethanofuran dehydrogenase operon n=1 Tax=Desulforhopalus singaporensis TaxID=91360 RepID=A0A1H0IVW4_9BACT|nr:formylmethanofuran dehydrogenase subunit E family protein [Desulforhopalus singaporensis]SDO35452.1 FmdE, Molybdenum formylmethanofuran dehydrogenase operon [Desulforhopalus singaporensis]
MLANIAFKRVVDFHGHVCPELALGSKFCEYVQHLLNENVLDDNSFSVLAENCTSALDAIQVLLGVTVGTSALWSWITASTTIHSIADPGRKVGFSGRKL